ncbi:carbohydrate sulfotransferase 13-like [Eriocheir sinensis]|uniref:carbohydrate sulfotransferase 13-like n=1 Tax=Eriocheir sinensis TaxID=95602 RepID=UPI0021CA39A7|nr:carbohydrate sulfotransferase 13-like [Eriocheir sinensis]
MGGRITHKHMVLGAVVFYSILALTTNILETPDDKRDIFRLEKLVLRPREEVQVVEFQERRARVKEVCAAWGAYTSKVKFLKAVQKSTEDKIKDDIRRDKKDLSQSQLERLWQLNKRSSFHQIFVDRSHSLTWCKVPKAASTSWLHAFLQLAGVEEGALRDVSREHVLLRDKYPMLPAALLRRTMPVTMKFMVARHPFERVLSAYRDKLEDYERDLKFRGGYYYSIYGKKIVKVYRKSSIKGSKEPDPDHARKEPTFREFVQYLLDTDVEEYDEHWRPMFLLCTPCHVKYDIIAKMETLTQDSDFILFHRGLADKVQIQWSHRTDLAHKTSDVAERYYSQLTSTEVKQLYYKYLMDFLMFEYDLDPYMKLVATPNMNMSLGVEGNEEDEEYYYYDDDEYEEEDEEEEEEEEEEEMNGDGEEKDTAGAQVIGDTLPNVAEYALNESGNAIDNKLPDIY